MADPNNLVKSTVNPYLNPYLGGVYGVGNLYNPVSVGLAQSV
jgi:hypothetical protein